MENLQTFFDEYNLIRTPLGPDGKPLERSSVALFPGLTLARSEPAAVVLLYDSLLHQYPDAAMFLCKGREGADPLLNRKYRQRLLTQWRRLGSPDVIIASPEDERFFRGILPEISIRSLYRELLDAGISGGCSREIYRLGNEAVVPAGSSRPEVPAGSSRPEVPAGSSRPGKPACGGRISAFDEEIRLLAETMGAVIYPPGDSTDSDAAAILEALDPRDVDNLPLLTSSMDARNASKKQGRDAVHILELIFGMGPSNAHLAHDHDHGSGDGSDHGHDHQPPAVRQSEMSPAEKQATEELFSPQVQHQNLLDLRQTLLSLFWND